MADYALYSEQKGWAVDFSCPDDAAGYFRSEFAQLEFQGRKIVELGFGGGHFLAFARGRGAEIFGVEIQESIVDKARAAGYPAFSRLEDLLAGHAGAFDAVVALDVFEHLDHQTIGETLITVHRLLKAGGVLILRAPNGQSPFGRRTQHGDSTHVSVITPKKMEQLCFAKGLEVVRVANQARVAQARNPLHGLAKRLQFVVRDWCNAAISAIYGMGTTVLDENIVIWIRKAGEAVPLAVGGAGRS